MTHIAVLKYTQFFPRVKVSGGFSMIVYAFS